MSKRSKLLSLGLPALGLASLCMGAVLVVQNRPLAPAESPPRQPPEVPIDQKEFESGSAIGATGVSEPAGRAIRIAAHLGGIVTEVPITAFDRVEAGDLLFRVDDRRVRADLALREAQLEVARAELAQERSRVPISRAALVSATAFERSAQAGLEAARADLEDRENLFRIVESVEDPRAVSTQELDTRRFAAVQARARVSTAEAAVAEAASRRVQAEAELGRLVAETDRGEQPGPDLIAAERRVDQAEREVETFEVDLALHSVTSPISGVVLRVDVRPGEFAPAATPSGDALVVLGSPGPTRVRVQIDEVDIPRFDPRARAIAMPRGRSSERLELRYVQTEPLVRPKQSLAGRSQEIVDTRVMEVVYEFVEDPGLNGVGQLYDIYIAAEDGLEGGGR